MKKFPKLNNKGFAVSVILYAAIVLIVLILFLILSILATITKNKILIVDNIKEEVSGNIDRKSESLGEISVGASDEIISSYWHNNDFNIILSEPSDVNSNIPLTYYYGTAVDNINTVIADNTIPITTNMKNVTYYMMACRNQEKTVCTKIVPYLVNIDKSVPTFSVNGGSETYASSRTFTITSSALSGIDFYQYYVSDFIAKPSENDDITNVDEELVINGAEKKLVITEKGKYIHIRAVSNSGVKTDWLTQNLYIN